jgi:glycosyltransferase involved in cell wall biosynthesis
MKIWMINHYAVPQAWSTRHVFLGAELVRRGHTVSLFASTFQHGSGTGRSVAGREHIYWDQASGVEIGWLPTPAYSDNSFGRAWNMLVFGFRVLQLPMHCSARPDIIYGSTPSLFAALAGLAVARRLGVPFVLEIRDIWPQTLIDLGMSRFHPFVVLSAVIERYLYRHADAVVTVMPDATPHVVAHGGVRERIHWIPNGVSFDVAPPAVPPKPKDVVEVTYAGAYKGGNNPELILDAAAKLRQRGGPTLRFRIICSTTGQAAMLAKRAALGLTNVSIEAPVPKSQVYSLLSQADILVAPYLSLSVHRFGVSLNKLFDYMAVARPIVFGAYSSNHPVLDAGCGIECPPNDAEAFADAVSRLASMSLEERWVMGLSGRRYVEQNHNFARLAGRLETILASALREPLAALRAPQPSKS